jgi:hypothetical protein
VLITNIRKAIDNQHFERIMSKFHRATRVAISAREEPEMPKPKIAELAQSREKPIIVDLAANEVGMTTGDMGGCVSVIVLFNPGATGTFQNVRGQHGSGGIGSIDWDALMQGVPMNTTSYLVVAYASGQFERGITDIRNTVDSKAKGLRKAFVEHPNCLIDRTSPIPTIKEFGALGEAAKYDIRKQRSAL